MTQQALEALQRASSSRFPDSDYARDARSRSSSRIDHLAGKEMEIGRYYQQQQQYLGGDQPLPQR